tara:strand:+ start:563 stop:1054 length:492 start_codon:yes stop_codon:yes gene_type:complete
MYGDYQSIQAERVLLLKRIKPLQHNNRSDWEEIAYKVYVTEYRELTKKLKKRDKKRDAMFRELKRLEVIHAELTEQMGITARLLPTIKVDKKIRVWRVIGTKQWHTGKPPKKRVKYSKIDNPRYIELKAEYDMVKKEVKDLEAKLKLIENRIKTIKATLWLNQ